MEKVKLNIVGLSYSQTQSGAYALVLGEEQGKRRLPIIIGGFEAQAIAVELEKLSPSRPLTHDLFKNFAEAFSISVNEVIIYNLVEGIFFAKLICEQNGNTIEIDSRTSDAIAIAVRFNCPVYTYEFVLKTAGIIIDDDKYVDEEEKEEDIVIEEDSSNALEKLSSEELKAQLEEAIAVEDYELASQIRDELNKRGE